MFVERAAKFLDDLADRLDGWAIQSRRGGWSTHQVSANQKAANDCRREASQLRSVAEDRPVDILLALSELVQEMTVERRRKSDIATICAAAEEIRSLQTQLARAEAAS